MKYSRINEILEPLIDLGRDKGKTFNETSYPTEWIMHALVINSEPETAIELGSMTGYTSNVIAEALKYNGHGKLYSLEIRPDYVHTSQTVTKMMGLSKHSEFILGDANKTLPELLAKLDSIDFVYYDIDPKEDYLKYHLLVEKKLHKGSVITAHDTKVFPELNTFVSYISNCGLYDSINLPFERGLLVAVKRE